MVEAGSALLFHTVDLGTTRAASALIPHTVDTGSVRGGSAVIFREVEATPVALYTVLRRQTNRGHPKGIGDFDGADLTNIGRASPGSALLYTDANTTDIVIGGGASLTAMLDLRSTNTTTLRSSTGQDIQLLANGATADLLLTARGNTYNLNDAANLTLTTTNQTVVGAINEIVTNTNGPNLLATVTGIDATTAAEINLHTAVGTTIITGVILLCTEATGVTVAATAGVGIAAGADDIFPSEVLSGFTVANKAFTYLAAGAKIVALNAEVVKLGIDVGATGTSQSLTAYVLGFDLI